MKSRNGVYHTISESVYREEINYPESNMTLIFMFSSTFYQDKFRNKLIENRYQINTVLRNRYKFFLDFDVLADILIYSKIEKRGFLIGRKDNHSKDISFLCRNDIVLGGVQLINKHSDERFEITMQNDED